MEECETLRPDLRGPFNTTAQGWTHLFIIITITEVRIVKLYRKESFSKKCRELWQFQWLFSQMLPVSWNRTIGSWSHMISHTKRNSIHLKSDVRLHKLFWHCTIASFNNLVGFPAGQSSKVNQWNPNGVLSLIWRNCSTFAKLRRNEGGRRSRTLLRWQLRSVTSLLRWNLRIGPACAWCRVVSGQLESVHRPLSPEQQPGPEWSCGPVVQVC